MVYRINMEIGDQYVVPIKSCSDTIKQFYGRHQRAIDIALITGGLALMGATGYVPIIGP